ncbi:MAG: PepSY domain-containing protein [Planctomycetes bacterium]|nr:PepSY domain-containing protein [Planctomycetota bacterium]
MQTPITSHDAIEIARRDAEKAYRDLSPYNVHIELAEDGWHVDYQLNDRQSNGGGPHYVIDAETGAIRAKRYEQ